VGHYVISLLQTAPEGESFDSQTLNGIPYYDVIEVAAFVSSNAVQTHLHNLLEAVDKEVRIATERALAKAENPESISQFFDELSNPHSEQYTKAEKLLSLTEILIYLPPEFASRLVTALVYDAVEFALTVIDAPPGNEILRAVGALQNRFEPDVNGLFKCYLKICESPAVLSEYGMEWSVSWEIAWIVSRAALERIESELRPFLDSDGRVRDLAVQLIKDAAICKDIEETPQFGGALDNFLRSRPLIEKWLKRHKESREITVTGHALDGAAVLHFKEGETYRLRFRVGPPAAENLASGDTVVEDVPKGGLQTRWVVTSTDVEFVPQLSSIKVQKIGSTWLAEFDLLIPERGSSMTGEIAVLRGSKPGNLLVTIYAVSTADELEVYREVSVSLSDQPYVEGDETCKAPQHTHRKPIHEWTTPREHIQVAIFREAAFITTKRKRVYLENHEFFDRWTVTDNQISGAIKNVRDCLEKLRELQDTYLNDLNHGDIAARLAAAGGAWKPDSNEVNGWHPLPDQSDKKHETAFKQVQQTVEWRALAVAGYDLFNRCFPQEQELKLRAVLERLKPGSRIDFHWTKQSGPGWVSHVPWSLMYVEPVDVTGQTPADPEKFLGLRFRIASCSWLVNKGLLGLGDPDKTNSMHLLYWGNKPDDEVAVEAQWQADEYKKRKQSRLLPNPALPDLKKQIIIALDAPGPSPVGVLYFYCHCSVGDGNQPCLRFGNTSEDTLGRADLSQKSIPDAPLVFANACTTAQADPHMTSELEQSFFERGVRAFIGTETKVPGRLASKFAWLFFQFFYRQVDPDPIAAGEALTQARVFLWTQYKNVGGLFYSITNEYDLYLASGQEVSSLPVKETNMNPLRRPT
jgi:hypothetical protein